jgi:hypothetical protein
MTVEPSSDLLARVDERTARMEEDIRAIRMDLRHHYVTRDQFWPVRSIVYGFAGLVLVLVSTAIVSAVLV